MPTFTSSFLSVVPSQKLPDDLAQKLQTCRDTIDRLSALQERVDRELLEYRRMQEEPPFGREAPAALQIGTLLRWMRRSLGGDGQTHLGQP